VNNLLNRVFFDNNCRKKCMGNQTALREEFFQRMRCGVHLHRDLANEVSWICIWAAHSLGCWHVKWECASVCAKTPERTTMFNVQSQNRITEFRGRQPTHLARQAISSGTQKLQVLYIYQFCYDSHRRYIDLDLYKNTYVVGTLNGLTLSRHAVIKGAQRSRALEMPLPRGSIFTPNLTTDCQRGKCFFFQMNKSTTIIWDFSAARYYINHLEKIKRWKSGHNWAL